MDGSPAHGWEADLERWLEPFSGRLRHQAQRHGAPIYLKGLILPGERKSIEPPRPSLTAAAAQTD